ncbi:MAG: outer membrane protein transport protein [Acidobacteria bacterium]|nr:outer membrane protein transport protein [Acidobacteriota bacterium]
MKSPRSVAVLVGFLMAGAAPAIHAAGYAIYEHGARAMAMGGAFTAIAEGPYAIFYNPAGIVWNEGTEIGFGTTFIKPSSSFTSAAGAETDQVERTFFPTHIYMTKDIGEKAALGIGFFSPFGLAAEWPSSWTGKYRTVKAELETYYLNPTLAYELTPKLSVAGGVDVIISTAALGQKISAGGGPFGSQGDVTMDLTGDGTAVSFNAGMLYKPSDKVSIGVSYRHGANLELDGLADFTADGMLSYAFPDGRATTEIHVPYLMAAGVAFKPFDRTRIAVDVDFHGWSGAEQITITYDNAIGDPSHQTKESTLVQNYENSVVLRIGLEQQIGDSMYLRGGYVYDQTPVQDAYLSPSLPDANRNDFTAGFGIALKKLNLDFAYMAVLNEDRESENQDLPELLGGSYETVAHLFSVSLGYRF